jgi:hypothetical protein
LVESSTSITEKDIWDWRWATSKKDGHGSLSFAVLAADDSHGTDILMT